MINICLFDFILELYILYDIHFHRNAISNWMYLIKFSINSISRLRARLIINRQSEDSQIISDIHKWSITFAYLYAK